MKRKLRIFSRLAIICLSVCMFAFGVYAASTVSVTTSGTVTFNATGVYARVERTITGYDTAKSTGVITNFSQVIDSSATDNQVFDTLKDENLIFENADKDIVMTFTITNLAEAGSGRRIYVLLSDNETEEPNNVVKIASSLDGEFFIEPGDVRTIRIFMGIEDPNMSANAEYDYSFQLKNTTTAVTLDETMVTLNQAQSDSTKYSISNFVDTYDKSQLTNIIIPSTMNGKEIVEVGYSTGYGQDVFKDMTNLTNVMIEDGITYIGGVFENSGVKNLSLPESVKTLDGAIYNASNLRSISILGENVNVGGVFYAGCSNIEIVTIGKGFTTGSYMLGVSGETTFNKTKKVLNFIGTLNDWFNSVENNGGGDTSSTPVSISCMGSDLFLNGEELIDLEIPSTVNSIKFAAFEGCTSLKTVTMGANVTEIEDYAFAKCTNLNNFTIGEGVKVLGTIFVGDTNLKQLTMPAGITTFKDYAFANVDISNISISEKLNFTGSLQDWLSYDFNIMGDGPLCTGVDLYINNVKVVDLEIPGSITTINYGAFMGCSSVKNIVISEGVEKINYGAFASCANLKSISIPKSCTDLGYYSLANPMNNSFTVSYAGTIAEFEALNSSNKANISEGVKVTCSNGVKTY